jgi:hypothetical protein
MLNMLRAASWPTSHAPRHRSDDQEIGLLL